MKLQQFILSVFRENCTRSVQIFTARELYDSMSNYKNGAYFIDSLIVIIIKNDNYNYTRIEIDIFPDC